MDELRRIACLGGIYSNYLALGQALQDIQSRGVDRIFCLGDLGAFGPFPDRVFPLLAQYQVQCIQGNYDDSIGNRRDDCQCGYTDPRDNYFAQLSYDYTLANTSADNRAMMRSLPVHRRVMLGNRRVLMCHGSPRQVNEFLWESACSDHFLTSLCVENDCDVLLATHTGIKWHRRLPGPKDFVNVGALGRPENDGTPVVWYTLLETQSDELNVSFIPVAYDHERLASEMEQEGLPSEFSETIRTGWWTSCLEVLPMKERRRGQW